MFSCEDKPKIVSDLEFFTLNPLLNKNKKMYLIGSRKRDRILCASSENVMQQIKNITECLNGENSVQDIKNKIGCDDESLSIVLTKLHKAGLLDLSEGIANSELELVAKNIVSVSIGQISTRFQKICKNIVSVYPIIITILFLFIILLLFDIKANPFSVIYSGKDIIISSLLMYGFTITHEFGHLLVAWSENMEVKSINISLRWYVIPIVYVKYRGINFLQPRIKIKLLMGGLCMNLFWAMIFFIMWHYVQNNIVLLLAMYNFTMFLASLYPQTLSDGYYILLLLTNRPSIRLEAVRWIFSSHKSAPSKMIILFVGIYIFCSVGGLYSTYLVFGKTITKFCFNLNINPNYAMSCYLVIYLSLIVKMIKNTKKKLIE